MQNLERGAEAEIFNETLTWSNINQISGIKRSAK